MNKERSFNIMRTIASMAIAVIVAIILIILVSDDPSKSIRLFFIGPFTKSRYIGNIIEAAVPLVFSGLAMSVVFQANLINMGAEGIFFFSGAIISMIAIWAPLPFGVHQGTIIIAGALVGAVVMLIIGLLKAKFGASELVSSLMMNNVLLGVGSYIMSKYMQDPMASQGSYPYAKTALLGSIIPGTRIHAGLIIALICAALVYLFIYRTKWGYEIRMVGQNKRFAEYSGINVMKVIIVAHIVSGLISGMGGAIESISMHKRFEWSALPGYGFDGALIAMLANNNPIGVIFSALFVAYLRIGADMVARLSDVPTELVIILQSLIILLISAERFLHSYKQRWIERGIE